MFAVLYNIEEYNNNLCSNIVIRNKFITLKRNLYYIT